MVWEILPAMTPLFKGLLKCFFVLYQRYFKGLMLIINLQLHDADNRSYFKKADILNINIQYIL